MKLHRQLFAIVLLGSGCSQQITEADGLKVAQQFAADHGYELRLYELGLSGEGPDREHPEWFYDFLCKSTPDDLNGFMVVVDRESRKATLYPSPETCA